MFGGNSLEEEQKNDSIKEQLAIKNGIKNYIIIDCRKSELNWVKNSIRNSKVKTFLDLKKVAWIKCHEYACGNIVKECGRLWNKSNTTRQISKLINRDISTVINYLKKGNELGFCKYDPKEVIRESAKINGKKVGKMGSIKIINLQNMNTYENAQEVEKELGIPKSNIFSWCRCKFQSKKGYRFLYLKDYEYIIKNITNNPLEDWNIVIEYIKNKYAK